MKQIIATLGDGSQIIHKIVPDDFDVGAWAEKRRYNFQQLNITSIKIERIPMTIYVLQQSSKYDSIQGVWTTLDDMTNWIGERFANCGEGDYGKTPLDEFMDEHLVRAYQDGAGADHEIIDWTEIIPQ
jgi:hypothetical protein